MTSETSRPTSLPGVILESLPNDLFRVRLDDQTVFLAHVSARRNKDFLRLLPGDRVVVEPSRDDPRRGRITQRC
jgi:translation initiation factor IF-1